MSVTAMESVMSRRFASSSRATMRVCCGGLAEDGFEGTIELTG